jgi:hypothetical protein
MLTTVTTTVIAPAETYDLTTLATVKDELSITTNVSDATLKRYISSASAAAAQYCNRVFPVEAVSDTFLKIRDPRRGLFYGRIEPLQLSRWPVIAVASLIEDGTTLVEGTGFLVNYVIGSVTRLGLTGLPVAWRHCDIVITYTAGYDPLPPDVEDAIVRMVTRRYSAKGRDPNLKQQSVPGVIEQQWWIATGTESGNLSPDISDVLDNYRTPVVY